MTATLSQSDAERFTIFVDAVIESPRFNFSAFCKAAKLTADQAIGWVTRPDIVAALESCITFLAAAARIRHTVLDTNAMGALGQLLHTSTNDTEIRRAATTIISRHKADLRPSRASASGATGSGGTALPGGVPSAFASPDARCPVPDALPSTSLISEISNLNSKSSSASHTTAPSSDPRDIHREAVEVPSRGSPRSGIPGTASQTNPHPSGVQVLPTNKSPSHSTTSSPVDSLLQLKLLADTLRLRKEPAPREPHSPASLLNRVGAPTSLSRDRPR